MDLRLTNNEAELLRAITANRLDGLMKEATDVTRTGGQRQASMSHLTTVGELLIAIDEAIQEAL